MKRIYLILFFFLFILSGAGNIEAQTSSEIETVYMKNGSIIKGIIVEKINNEYITIKTPNGSIIKCNLSDIDKVVYNTDKLSTDKQQTYGLQTRPLQSAQRSYIYNNSSEVYYAPVVRPSNKRTLRGYKAFVDIGWIGDINDSYSSKFEIATIHGYQFNNYIFLGAGIAFDNYYDLSYGYDNDCCTGYNAVPIFVNFKVNFINRKVTPFSDIRLGYSCGDIEGTNFSLGFGVRFGLGRKTAINLRTEYHYQLNDNYYYEYSNYYDLRSFDIFYGFGFKVGFEF